MSIKKLIFKTAFGSVVIFFSLLLFVFNVFSLFFTPLAADISDSLNAGGLAISLTRNVYDKSGDINDASVLIERAIKYNDFKTIIKYIPQLKSYEYYDDFTVFKDKQGVSVFSDYKNYIDGNYLIALYAEKHYDVCLNIVKGHLSGGYATNNPVCFLVRQLYMSGINFKELTALLTAKFNDDSTNNEDKINLCRDIYSLYFGAGDNENAQLWYYRYKELKDK